MCRFKHGSELFQRVGNLVKQSNYYKLNIAVVHLREIVKAFNLMLCCLYERKNYAQFLH